MAIYMQYPNIPGAVTEEGHKGWIEINSFQWGVGRGISTPVGRAENREASMPSVSRPAPHEDMCPRGIVPRKSVSYGPKYPMSLPGHTLTRRACIFFFTRAIMGITSSTWKGSRMSAGSSAARPIGTVIDTCHE